MGFKNIQDFKTEYYFLNPKEYGRIYIFIDFGNVRPWAKDLWKEENKYRISVEITMDMLQKIEKYNSVLLFSGDSDFYKLLEYIKSKGKKIIIVCTRNCMSSELDKIKDKFIQVESLKSFIGYNTKNTPPRRAEE